MKSSQNSKLLNLKKEEKKMPVNRHRVRNNVVNFAETDFNILFTTLLKI